MPLPAASMSCVPLARLVGSFGLMVMSLPFVTTATSPVTCKCSTCALLRPGAGAGQQHLQGDRTVKTQVPRPVDDAHLAHVSPRLAHVASRRASSLPPGPD